MPIFCMSGLLGSASATQSAHASTICPRGALVHDIVNTVAITAIQAQGDTAQETRAKEAPL